MRENRGMPKSAARGAGVVAWAAVELEGERGGEERGEKALRISVAVGCRPGSAGARERAREARARASFRALRRSWLVSVRAARSVVACAPWRRPKREARRAGRRASL